MDGFKIIKSGWVRRTQINWQSIVHQDCTLPRLQRFMRFKGESCCPSSPCSYPPHLVILVKHDAQAEDKLAALWPSEADHHLGELTTYAAASPHQLPVTKFIKSRVSFDNRWWDRETSYQFRKYLRSDCCCAKVCLSRFIFNLNQSHDSKLSFRLLCIFSLPLVFWILIMMSTALTMAISINNSVMLIWNISLGFSMIKVPIFFIR